jgi:hypothetical protein
MNHDRQFWGNQPRKRPVDQGSMMMKLIQCPDRQFELVLGAVRITLSPSELLKMRKLISRGAQLYKDSLQDEV